MHLFFEKILAPLVVALMVLIFTNPMRFDWTQRITGAMAILFACFFIAHTLEKSKEAPKAMKLTAAVAGPKGELIPPTTPEIHVPAKPAPSPSESHPKPQQHSPIAMFPKVKTPLSALTGGQRFLLKRRLGEYEGRTVRLVLIGNDPAKSIANEELLDIFGEAKWNIQKFRIGLAIVNGNFPDGNYMTSQNMADPLVTKVFTIFSDAGVELPLTPGSFMGNRRQGVEPDIAIVLH
jgi:hypothetical protein